MHPDASSATAMFEGELLFSMLTQPAPVIAGSAATVQISLPVLDEEGVEESEPPSRGGASRVGAPDEPRRKSDVNGVVHANDGVGTNGVGALGAGFRPRVISPAYTIDDADGVVMSEAARRLRDRAFPGASDADWCDWKWQLRNRIRDAAILQRLTDLTGDEAETIMALGDRLPVGITPHYATAIDWSDPADPIRKTMVPVGAEFERSPVELDDPLAEDEDMPVPGLVHRYPDRVLFLVTSFCATYCRYCTRSRLVGKTGEYHFNTAQFERALDYLRGTPSVRDVLISGGDPLTMNDSKIDWLLTQLRSIEHIDFVRIGSKIPVVLPQRITTAFCAMLKRHQPWISVHAMHPAELTPEVAQSCGRLADAGIPLGSQTVLTAGVNDDVATMKRLMHGLLKIRVRPYYIYQCDPIPGSGHFRVPVERGLEIIEGLRGHTTGYAVPNFVIDAPGGGGKIPLTPNSVVGRDGDAIVLRNYEGREYRYPDPVSPGAPTSVGATAAAGAGSITAGRS